MTDEHPQPDLRLNRGDEPLGELSLPGPLVADLKREFTPSDAECPAWVTVAVATAYERRREVIGGRRRALRFAVVAASISLIAFVGMRMNRGAPAPEAAPRVSERALAIDARGPGGPESTSKLGTFETGGLPRVGGGGGAAGVVLMRDINHDGAVNILDAMRLAKAVASRDTSFKLEGNSKFHGLTLDVSWDLNGDGNVDQADVEALALLAVEGGAS